MVKPTEHITNLPSRVFSRLTPTGSIVGKDYLRLENYNRNRLSGESTLAVFYNDSHIRFGYDDKGNSIWVVIESAREPESIDKSGLAKLLQSPENLSVAKPNKRNEYLALVSKGRVYTRETGELSVKFKLLRENADPEKVFEAFWFSFKPVIKAIHNNIPHST